MFDYAALDAETRIVVQQRTTEIKALMKRAASDIIEIGQKLIDVKARLGHGNFRPWLKMEFDWSQDTAQNFMNVAAKFGNFPNLDGMAPSALYLLAAPSTPESARIEAVVRAEEGEPITHSLAQGIVHDHKNPALPFDPDKDEDTEPLSDYEQSIAERYQPRLVPTVGAPTYAPISDRLDYDGDEWKTPIEWLDAARDLFGGSIDLDPASNDLAQDIVQASEYYTKDENGLARPWNRPDGSGARVWCNPPYSTELVKSFTYKALEEYRAGNADQVLVLVNNCTDTRWFYDLAQHFPVMFSRGRVGFWYENPDDKTPTRQGQALFYFGPDAERFYASFAHLAYAPIGRRPAHANA